MQPSDRQALLQWYAEARRDLPWRRSRDPYAIWVSEVMLQQTRVVAAIPHYERWMARFPTVAALAQASENDVLEAWSGLGYYTRARNLHRAAKVVVDEHGGALPQVAAQLRQLPGVGPYTAGAIASIAFGERIPAVDGNVVRVACRVAGIRADPTGSATRARIEGLASSWVADFTVGSPGDWNQALMELGSTVCTPKSPKCGACPVAPSCKARRLGLAHRIPPPRLRTAVQEEKMHFAAVVRDGRILLVRNPPGLLGGLWSLPGGPASTPLGTLVRQQSGVRIRMGGRQARVQHAFTHRTWAMVVRRATPVRALASTEAAQRETTWQPVARLKDAALSTAMRKALDAVGVGI